LPWKNRPEGWNQETSNKEHTVKKTLISSLVFVIVLVSPFVYADVVRKLVENPDGTQAAIYESEGKEVAKELLNQDGSVIKKVGKVPDGLVKEFFLDGAIREEVYYKNGKKEGVAKFYNKKGVVRGEFNFKNGKQDGLNRTYYPDGELLKEITFKNGKLEGINREYTKDGKLRFEANFKDDKQDGLTTIYHPDGSKTVSVYQKGQLKSEKHYDAEGKLTE
jgi:antitoxin component YwqK of YwqJK toxin-antitoxin module